MCKNPQPAFHCHTDGTISHEWQPNWFRTITVGLSFITFSLFWVTGPGLVCYSKDTDSDGLSVRISGLIDRLADPNYSSRLNAQSELERIGVVALDQLHTASFHPDPQIAAMARYIVQSNQFTWAWETDPLSVRQILANYGRAQHADKSAYIDLLQNLEHDEGFAALCRLVRYETQSGLAKRAALILMRSKPTVDQDLQTRKDSLVNSIQGGQSQASRWVLKYANRSTTFDLAWWQQMLADELALLNKSTGETNLELVEDLHRWVIEQIATMPDLRQHALSIGRSLLSLGKAVPTLDSMIGNRTSQADVFAQWALKFKMPELVQEQHAKLPSSTISREFIFGYYLAESFLLQGKNDLAAKVASLSLQQIACDERGENRTANELENPDPIRTALDSVFTIRNSNDLERRKHLADKLQERGQFAWAESEFRVAIYKNEKYDLTKSKAQKDGSEKPEVSLDLTLYPVLHAMASLAAMLHSQERFGEAANVLEPFVERINREPMFRKQMLEWSSFTQPILSNYHLYRGDECRQTGDIEKAKTNYWSSIEGSSDNVDALIGLYKIPLSKSDEASRVNKLKEIIAELRMNIRNREEILKASDSSQHATILDLLSRDYNTLAWVIANTEGSKEEALFLSRKACQLYPESAERLDTLAHCYAAMDKYQDAVQQQRRALELKPFHPELLKALQRFESKLRAAK